VRTSKNRTTLGWLGSWLFTRGEGPAVSFAGWGLAVTGLALVAGSVWTLHAHTRAAAEGEARALERAARVLASSSEELLASNDIESLSRVVSDTAIEFGLDDASISLAGVGVVASKSGGSDLTGPLPATWQQSHVESHGSCTITNRIAQVEAPLRVSGRGDGVVTLRGPVVGAQAAFFSLAAVDATTKWGLLGIAGGTLALGFVAFRAVRRRLLALGAIEVALHQAADFASGEMPASAMRVSDQLGSAARTWNRMLEERDQMRATSELEAAAERMAEKGGGGEFAGALDALWMGVVMLDAEGRIHGCNGAAAVFLKRSRPDLLGRPFQELAEDPGLQNAVREVVSGASRQRITVEVPVEGDVPGVDRTMLRYTVRPMRKDDAVACIVVIEDVTQQRVADDSRNSFVAQATHELRTPLTNIRLYLEQLVDEGDRDPLVKARCINVISTEARRLERTVTDMLSVNEIEAGAFKVRGDDVPLEAVLDELYQDFQAQAQDKEIDYKLDLPPKLPRLWADRDKFTLALHNLVGNALKYTPAGGRVHVRVSEDAGQLRVDVVDNGIGISEEEQELVFERFYRSKDRRVGSIQGTGIGLALARQVVRLHGGDITVRSELDKGSTFTLVVPISPSGAGVGEARLAA
jgi:signal transduction histidine kinase